jgi:hypothetical protein
MLSVPSLPRGLLRLRFSPAYEMQLARPATGLIQLDRELVVPFAYEDTLRMRSSECGK